jgi:hypothetical protein
MANVEGQRWTLISAGRCHYDRHADDQQGQREEQREPGGFSLV